MDLASAKASVLAAARGSLSDLGKLLQDLVDGTLTIGGLTMDGPLKLKSYTVAGVPTASAHTGALIYVSNGAAGDPVVAFSDGTNWLRVDTKVAITATT